MSLVPTDLVASYNGYVFNPARTLTTALRVRPVEDKAGRTASYQEYTLALRTEEFADGGAEADTREFMKEVRQKLTKYGGALVYTGRGLGDLNLNVSSHKDVLYGPKPRLLNLKYLGGKRCWRIDWEVTLHLPDCNPEPAGYPIGIATGGLAGPAAGGFPALEFTFRVEFRIRKNGRTDRVVSGELRVPNNRRVPGSRKPLLSPDNYREKLVSPVPANFTREFAPWVIDESRTRLSFGWTDSELDGPAPPVGILGTPKVSHTTRSSGVGLMNYVSTIRGEYELAPGYNERYARRAFLALVADRVINARQRFRGKVSVTLQSFEATQGDLYGQPRAEYSLTYAVYGANMRDAIRASGLWRPIDGLPGGDWKAWQTSLAESALNPRGVARLTFSPGEDAIVDLCGGDGSDQPKNPALPRPLDSAFGYPVPERSWVHYEVHAECQVDAGVAEHRPLPVTPEPPSDGTSGGVMQGTPFPSPPPESPKTGFDHRMKSKDYPPVSVLNPNWREEATYGNTQPNISWPPDLPGGIAPGDFELPGNYGEGMQEPREVRLEREQKREEDFLKAQKAGPEQGDFERLAGAAAGQPQQNGQARPGGPQNNQQDAGQKPDIIIQKRVRPKVEVFLVGQALRVGYPIPCPSLTEVEGMKPVIANRLNRGEGFVCGVVRVWGGIPVYGARWRLRYLLPNQPKGPIVPPNNPVIGN